MMGEGSLGGRGGRTDRYTLGVTDSPRTQSPAKGHSQQYCHCYVWGQVGTGHVGGTLCKVYDCLTVMLYT